MIPAYEGVVHHGTVRLPPGAQLPEGARVYVVVTPMLDERTARRKAARWLLENVGNLVMPGSATLVREAEHMCWRFPALVSSPFCDPRGPIGHVDVDATSGVVLAAPHLASEMIRNAEHFEDAVLSPGD